MKYEPWRKEKGPVFSLDMKQFEPLFKLRAILENFKRLDLTNRSVSWIAANLIAAINHQKIAYDYIKNPTPVYRGQKLTPGEENPLNVSRLWYPPRDKVLHMGRLNRKGQQVFYGASSAKGVLFELDPQPNEVVGLLECALIPNQPEVKLVQLGMDRGLLSRTKNANGLKDVISAAEKRHESNLIVDDIPIGDLSESYIIQKFFHEMLSHKPESLNYDFYKITVGIGEVWLHNPDVSGIVYPGIATRFLRGSYFVGHNIAFRKETVDRAYRPSRVWLCRCRSLTDKGYAVEVLSSSERIDSTGKIDWAEIAIDFPM